MAGMVERGASGWIGHSARIEPGGGDGPPGRGGKLSDQVRRGGLYRMAGPRVPAPSEEGTQGKGKRDLKEEKC